MGEHPKRRKHRDNPYTLECEQNNRYIVSFRNGTGNKIIVEVSEEVYKSMDKFELEDKSELNEYARHIEHSEIFEESLYKRVMDKPLELEDYIIRKSSFEELYNAIKQLPEIQQKRIKMYYFDELTLDEIAIKENCSKVAIKYSLNYAIKNLEKILKK